MTILRIATWNVNSLRVRLPQLKEWLSSALPDIVALQETKQQDTDFPHEVLRAMGYEVAFSGQRTYNGVAILSRHAINVLNTDIPGYPDQQRRVLAVETSGLCIVNIYIPNGQTLNSDKYQYKLDWLAALEKWLKVEVLQHPKMIVLGDFNIAPEDRDVHDPKAWANSVLTSESERAALEKILGIGFIDVFRNFDQPEKSYSWWDYRAAAFRRNNGVRIDLILASMELAALCTSSSIDREPRRAERPSDHTPVLATFKI